MKNNKIKQKQKIKKKKSFVKKLKEDLNKVKNIEKEAMEMDSLF